MTLLWWIIFGGIVGGIAKLIMPGKDPGGCLATIGLGILGSVVGGLILGLLAIDPGSDRVDRVHTRRHPPALAVSAVGQGEGGGRVALQGQGVRRPVRPCRVPGGPGLE